MEEAHYLPLHKCHVHKLWGTLNKTYAFLHFLALSAIVYYRGAFYLNKNDPRYSTVPFLPWLIVFIAELILAFFSVLKQPFYWWPVTRTAFPERLPKDEKLPGIDVFICTADPTKEPTFEVMNTVVSAMALDYPTDKLNIYLSDDGGAPVTLKGMKEAWAFATWWLPFCKRYNVKTVCPMAYFEGSQQEENHSNEDFIEERRRVKEKYELFKERVRSIWKEKVGVGAKAKAGHSTIIQVINQNTTEGDTAIINPEHTELPLLVYVAREKRPSHPHNFKAGALNALLRVSSTFSNSPYILVLDCDMYCNDSISARQAMCFHLDPKISPSLGWVQYPQKFHNITESDVYDSQMRAIWTVLWCGVDGLQGPVISGTNFYIKRKALYGTENDEGNNVKELRNRFGPSNEFIKSVNHIDQSSEATKRKEISSTSLKEAEFLACCTFEDDTKWGDKVGFRYKCVVEDVMTGLYLQSKGWRSVYMNPTRPQFLGTATTNLNDMLIQGMRWYSGMLSVGLSKYWPLIYRPSKMQFLHKMPFSWMTIFPLDCIPNAFLAILPSLCFLYGIPLYPKVSDSIFIAYAYIFIAPQLKMLYEHLAIGGSASSCMNEKRIWSIRTVTCNIYGSLECVMTKLGLREATFNPTNKADDDDKTKYYQMGKYDFRTSNMFLIPLVTVVTLNLACFFGGLARVIVAGNWDQMFAQLIFSIYVLILSFPVTEGMLLRKDNGRVPPSSTLISTVVSLAILCLGYIMSSH